MQVAQDLSELSSWRANPKSGSCQLQRVLLRRLTRCMHVYGTSHASIELWQRITGSPTLHNSCKARIRKRQCEPKNIQSG